jgi:hypothetical protein
VEPVAAQLPDTSNTSSAAVQAKAVASVAGGILKTARFSNFNFGFEFQS